MKKIKLIFTILIYQMITTSNSYGCFSMCTSPNSKQVFGYSFDWSTGTGQSVHNPRGMFREGNNPIALGSDAKWISKYNSISFNVLGPGFPMTGMNEKGLTISVMVFMNSEYPSHEDSFYNDDAKLINESQWVQYHLDNSANIYEVIENSKKIIIESVAAKLHYMVCEPGCNCAIFEFAADPKNEDKGTFIIYKDKNLPYNILANDAYAKSIYQATKQNYKIPVITQNGIIPSKKDPGTYSSTVRIQTGLKVFDYWKSNSNLANIDDQDTILNKNAVSDNDVFQMFLGLNYIKQGNYTKWQIVYDQDNLIAYFRSRIAGATEGIKTIDLNRFEKNCNQAKELVLDIYSPYNGDVYSPYNGDVYEYFENNDEIKIETNNDRIGNVDNKASGLNLFTTFFFSKGMRFASFLTSNTEQYCYDYGQPTWIKNIEFEIPSVSSHKNKKRNSNDNDDLEIDTIKTSQFYKIIIRDLEAISQLENMPYYSVSIEEFVNLKIVRDLFIKKVKKIKKRKLSLFENQSEPIVSYDKKKYLTIKEEEYFKLSQKNRIIHLLNSIIE